LIASHLPARTEMQYAAVQILTLGKGGEKSQSSAGRRGDCLRLFPDEGDPGAPDSGGLQTRDPTKKDVESTSHWLWMFRVGGVPECRQGQERVWLGADDGIVVRRR
jgi:hypothetical protein